MAKITNPAGGEFTLPVGSHPDKAARDLTAPPRYVDQLGPQVVQDYRDVERPDNRRRV